MRNDAQALEKIVSSLKKRKKGSTAADICAATALPLSLVNELLPVAADEYSGHLRVTESGEILYYFPGGFKSRYKGFGAKVKRFTGKAAAVFKSVLAFLFKAWIMIMLAGYFIVFIALALAAIFIQIASRSNNNSGKEGFSGFGIFDLIFRIWFYSALTRPHYDDYHDYRKPKEEPKRPMHISIFSFIFGEKDPNKDWNELKDKAIILFLQANKGIISLAEYMAFTGDNSLEAEAGILSFCSRYEGSPEVSEEGTIVYRFEKLLLGTEPKRLNELIRPVKKIKTFSDNKKSLNAAIAVINTVNLIFGSYFLYQSNITGVITDIAQYQTVSKLYGYTYMIFDYFMNNPSIVIGIALGIIPLIFSVIFWIIPIFRFFTEKKDNQKIKLSNFKRFSFNKIWTSPLNIEAESLKPPSDLYCPDNIKEACDRVIKDIGAFSVPEVKVLENGRTIYSFNELEKEKQALIKYRLSADTSRLNIGKTIFDSGE